MQPIVIFGAGGFGREVLGIILDINAASPTWDVLGFVDDEAPAGEIRDGLPVLGGRDWLQSRRVHMALALGEPAAKCAAVSALRPHVLGFATIVHPSSIINETASVGEGCVVAQFCAITSQVEIGPFCLVNAFSALGHDVRLGAYCTASPSTMLMGHVAIGDGCDIGVGARFIPGVRVGHWSAVGAGAVVVRDLPANCTAVGCPAQVIKRRSAGWHLAEPVQEMAATG